jgi:hypothetical protein
MVVGRTRYDSRFPAAAQTIVREIPRSRVQISHRAILFVTSDQTDEEVECDITLAIAEGPTKIVLLSASAPVWFWTRYDFVATSPFGSKVRLELFADVLIREASNIPQTFLEAIRNSWKVEGNRMMITDRISSKELSSLCFSASIESLWIYNQNQRIICTLWII